MRSPIPLLLSLAIAQGASAQCTETALDKVLLVGDSWAFFMGVDQTINGELGKWGHSGYRYYTNLVLAENGAETDDFLTPGKQAEIATRLLNDPGIKVVHLSLGGNDVLGDWDVDFTAAETDSLKAEVSGRLQQVIDFILDVRPDVHVLWSGYMYPNFGEVIEDLSPLQPIHPFYGTWQGMGFPSFEQLNTILNDFSAELEARADTMERLSFVNATGLMQHVFGQTQPLGVSPGGSYPALAAPLPAGFVDYPSPKASMRNYGLTRDCFHLSAAGYDAMVDLQMRKFYHKFLMDDQYLLADPATAGSVSDLGNVTNTLQVGATGTETYSTVLTFPTTAMTGSAVASASIFLRRSALWGPDPLGGTMEVRVKSGAFGGSYTVEALDAGDQGDAGATACRFGSNAGDGHWVRIDLPAAMLPFITPGAETQFMLSTGGAPQGLLAFSGAADPELAPVLNLRFEDISTGAPRPAPAGMLALFPNPTDGPVVCTVPAATVRSIRVIDALGRTVLLEEQAVNTIDLGGLPSGQYLVEVISTEGRSVGRVVKW